MEKSLPAIPAKRYFTIGEVSELCGVKPYVLRYWEQEFTQLKPMKRRGNRRYYQHHEVLLIRRIRELLYDQGFTISGARNRLADAALQIRAAAAEAEELADAAADGHTSIIETAADRLRTAAPVAPMASRSASTINPAIASDAEEVQPTAIGDAQLQKLRTELLSIRDLLSL
jgi:DNA-binding transcriptional MerR regulator